MLDASFNKRVQVEKSGHQGDEILKFFVLISEGSLIDICEKEIEVNDIKLEQDEYEAFTIFGWQTFIILHEYCNNEKQKCDMDAWKWLYLLETQ